MTLLALDPSSTCTGFAIGTGPRSLLSAGVLKPGSRDTSAIERAETMAADLPGLIEQYQVGRAIVEIPARQAPRKGNQGQATYGMAAGAIYAALLTRWPLSTVPVTERMWTRWRGNKLKHQAAIAGLYAGYDAQQDAGADLADAIGLGRWWWLVGQKQGGDEGERVGVGNG